VLKSLGAQSNFVHPDDLKTIWECHDCGRKFFYHSDITSHVRDFRHSKVVSRDYDAKKRDSVFVRRNISLSFKVEGETLKLQIECKYYPSTDALIYTNVSYSDEKLKSMVEGKPELMSKVDMYLRQLIHAQKSKGQLS
jgi:hypothetical protein